MQENERPYKDVTNKELKQMLIDALFEAAPLEAELRHRGYSVSIWFHNMDSYTDTKIWEDGMKKESVPAVSASKTENIE